jgi:hypothetical protein
MTRRRPKYAARVESYEALVPGEYQHVAFGSADVAVMREAHATPCTVPEARAILAALAATHGLPDLSVRFGSEHGRGGQRALYRRVREPGWPYRRVVTEAGVSHEACGLRWRREWCETLRAARCTCLGSRFRGYPWSWAAAGTDGSGRPGAP